MQVRLGMSKEFRKAYAISTGVSLDDATFTEVAPASLQEAVRRIVLEYGSENGTHYPECLRQLEYRPSGASRDHCFPLRADVAPEDVTPDVVTAAILLAALELETDKANEAISALKAKQDADAARRALDKEIEEFLAAPDACLAPDVPWSMGHPLAQRVYDTSVARRKAAEKAQKELKELPRRLWVMEHGTPIEKEMLEAGALDMGVVDRAMECHVFRPVGLPLFEYPTVEEMEAAVPWGDREGRDEVSMEFDCFDHEGPLTEEVWVAFKRAREEVENALAGRAGILKITLRQHSSFWDMRSWPELRRWAVEVKATAFGLEFTREFGLPGAPDWIAEDADSTVTRQ